MAIKKFTKELPGDMVGQKTTAVPMSNLAEAEWVTPVHISSLTGTLPVDVTFPDSMTVVDSVARTSLAAIDTKLGATLNVSDASARTTLTSINTALAGTIKTSVQNWPATQAVTVSNFPATQPVSGSISVSNFPATQAVSGTVSIGNWPSTQAVSDSTARTSLAAIDTKLGGTLSVSSSTLLAELTNVKTEVQNVKAQLQTTLSTKLVESTIMQPVEVQSKLATTINVINAVSIDFGAWKNSAYYDLSGFDKLAVSVNMTSGTGMTVTVDFSHDGSTFFANPSTNYDGTQATTAFEVPIMARYARISVKNKDAATARTTSAYIYLKA